MDVSIMKVTPDLAMEWLGFNSHNRNMRGDAALRGYTDAMEAGHWKNDIMPIAFAGKLGGKGRNAPVLLNGQHRLQALVNADRTVEFIVVEGLEISDQANMDSGIKRQLADQLRLDGHPYSTQLAAVLRLVYNYYQRSGDPVWRNTPATHATLLHFLAEHKELPESMSPSMRLWTAIGGRASVYGAAHYIISRIDDPAIEEELEEFYDSIASGANLSETSPILKYRKTIQAQNVSTASRRRLSQITQLALIFKAWNAWRDGVEISVLSWRGGGKNPEPFPRPE